MITGVDVNEQVFFRYRIRGDGSSPPACTGTTR